VVPIVDVPVCGNACENYCDLEGDDDRVDNFYSAFTVDRGNIVEEAVNDVAAARLLTDRIEQITSHNDDIDDRVRIPFPPFGQ